MKERPILFNGPMIRAILDGRKTQTRRVIKTSAKEFCDLNGVGDAVFTDDGIKFRAVRCPYGDVGDRLWVRETFVLENNYEYHGEWPLPTDGRPIQYRDGGFDYGSYELIPHYRATDPDPHIVPYECDGDNDDRTRWKPSIFMPRWASRITLEVKSVRVERVQDISYEDAVIEGIERINSIGPLRACGFKDYGNGPGHMQPQESFRSLWDSINFKRGHGWCFNPYVWVVEFERVSAPSPEEGQVS